MKYIDADKLREKITEQMDSVPREVGRGAGTITSTGYGMMQAFQVVRSIIDSLQQEQPEVDLEKEIEKWFDLSGIGEAWENGEWSTNDVTRTARHFYELGLNARKED